MNKDLRSGGSIEDAKLAALEAAADARENW